MIDIEQPVVPHLALNKNLKDAIENVLHQLDAAAILQEEQTCITLSDAKAPLKTFLKQLSGFSPDALLETYGPRPDKHFRRLVRDFLSIRNQRRRNKTNDAYDPTTRTISFPTALDDDRCPLLEALTELRSILEDGRVKRR